MAESDSGGPLGAPATPDADGQPAAEPAIEFGAGMQLDASADADPSESQAEQPDDATPAGGTTPAADADSAAAPDEGGTLRQADYTRKTQALAEDRRAWEAQKAEQMAAFSAREAALEELRRAQNQPPQNQSTLAAFAEHTRQRLMDPNLTPEQRAVLQSDLQGVQVVQTAVDEGIRAALAPVVAQLNTLTPLAQQAGQQAGALTEANQRQHLAIARGQMEEVVSLFGQETWDGAGKMVAPLFFRGGQFVPVTDPVTGADMTMAEVTARLIGKDIEAAKAAQDGNRQARQVAQQGAAPRGTTPAADVPTGVTPTRAQAIAQMKANDPTLV